MGTKPKCIYEYHPDSCIDYVSTSFDARFMSKLRLLKYGPFKTFRNVREADIVIFVNGGALSDWNPSSTCTLFDLIRYWKKKGTTMFMFGVGAGPISKPKSFEVFEEVLSCVECITVRDDYSYQELRKIGLNNITKTKDLAFGLHPAPHLRETTKRRVEKIGVVAAPVCLETPDVYARFCRSLALAVKKLINDGFDVSLIPFQSKYDYELMKYLRQQNPKARLLNDSKDFWSPLRNLREQDLIIGQRYHSLIEAIAASKLIVPIVYHPKCWSLCVDFGLESYASFIGNGNNWEKADLDPDRLCDAVYRVQCDDEYFETLRSVWIAKCSDNTERRLLMQSV